MENVNKILVAEDNDGLTQLIKVKLKQIDLDVDSVTTAHAIMELDLSQYSLLILDYSLPDMNASELLINLNNKKIKLPFIIMTGNGNESIAVEMMKFGARDYIIKEANFIELLVPVVKKVLSDISLEEQLKISRQALLQSELKNQIILETASIGIMFIDSLENIIYANEQIENYFLYSRGEIVGQSIQFLIPDDFTVLTSEIRQKFLKEPWLLSKNKNVELMGLRKDSSKIIMEINFGYFHSNSGVIIACFISDITEKKASDKELQLYRESLEELVEKRTNELMATNQKLIDEITFRKNIEQELIKATLKADEANNAKSEFLANISHELRTPLNSIIGFTKILLRGYSAEHYEKRLSNILSSGEHLLHIINDLLDLSKIEAGKYEFLMETFSVNRLINDTLIFVTEQANDKKINLRLQSQVGDDFVFTGDEKKIRQIMINLLSNALKFTPENGSVTINVSANSENLIISVKDTGIGISKEFQKYIFEKFTQVNSGLKRGNEGTGLGLAITKKIVEAHGGTIVLESDIGVGSDFIINLPLNYSPFKEQNNSDRQSNNYNVSDYTLPDWVNEKTILITDDEAINLEVLTSYLSANNVKTYTAKSAEEAFAIMSSNKIDLILMDLKMPEIDGIAAMRIIKDNYQVPIIAVTGFMIDKIKENYMDLGFDGFMAKPVEFRELNDLIIKLLK